MRFVDSHWLNSLNLKILLAFVAGSVLSIVLVVLAVVLIATSHGDILSGKAVAERAADLASSLRFDREGFPVGFDSVNEADVEDGGAWQYESLKAETAYRVLDASGKVVLSSVDGVTIWPQSGAGSRLERGRFEFEHAGVAMRGATEAVTHNGRTWFLQFAASTRFLQMIYGDFALPFAGVGILLFSLVLLFVFGFCGYVTLKYTLKPLREISESAAAISPQTLHARLQAGKVPAEIEPLVASFNQALERLEVGYRVQQEFLATAAHELKTPLALIRAQIELGVDEESREVLLQDVSRMGRQVQQLLHLAEASEAQNYKFAPVDAESTVFEVVKFLERLADQQSVRMQTVVDPGLVPLRADRGALFTLLKNLLENAIQHSRTGGVVRVRANANHISVHDEGPGVSDEDIPNLFVRFWRGVDRRDLGAGLGLSICREIATAHGWKLRARRADPGMTFELSIDQSEVSR
jgi:signal transduction histidine kinase